MDNPFQPKQGIQHDENIIFVEIKTKRFRFLYVPNRVTILRTKTRSVGGLREAKLGPFSI